LGCKKKLLGGKERKECIIGREGPGMGIYQTVVQDTVYILLFFGGEFGQGICAFPAGHRARRESDTRQYIYMIAKAA
jgi:hypothetical protein